MQTTINTIQSTQSFGAFLLKKDTNPRNTELPILKNLNKETSILTHLKSLYKHKSGFFYTPAVKYLVGINNAYSVIYSIFETNCRIALPKKQIWKLQRVFLTETKPTDTFILILEDDAKEIIVANSILYLKIPADTMELHLINKTLMLPTENN